MIRYTLSCERGHEFESWFPNSTGYDKQRKRGLVTCPACGSAKVEKTIMAPRLARSDIVDPTPPSPPPATPPQAAPAKTPVAIMSQHERELRQKLKELRDHVTKNASYVGPRFSEEARKIHFKDVEARGIYGEATQDEVASLLEEGVDFMPLPNLPEEHN